MDSRGMAQSILSGTALRLALGLAIVAGSMSACGSGASPTPTGPPSVGPSVSAVAPSESPQSEPSGGSRKTKVVRFGPFIASGGQLCRAKDVRAAFRWGGVAGSFLVTSVFLGNTSGQPCALQGPIQFVGLSANGQPVTESSTCNVSVHPHSHCAAPIVLPARAPFTGLGTHYRISDYAIIHIVGHPRDDADAANGACSPRNETTPATLLIEVGSLTFSVRNWDPTVTSTRASDHAVTGCRGNIGLGA